MKMVEYSLESIRKMLGKRDWLFFFFWEGGGDWGMVRGKKGSGI